MSASYKAKVIPFIKTKFGDSVKKAVCKICFTPTTKCHKKWQIAWVTTICVTTSHLRINCIHCLEWPAGNEIRYIFEIPQKHDKNKERIISHQIEQMQTQMFIFNTLRHYTVSFELLEYQFLNSCRFLDQAVMMIAKCTTVLLVNINWIQMPAFKWWNNKPIADKTCDLILKRNVRAGNIKTQEDFELLDKTRLTNITTISAKPNVVERK